MIELYLRMILGNAVRGACVVAGGAMGAALVAAREVALEGCARGGDGDRVISFFLLLF